MDNISHSVVSLVAGELLHRTLPAESSSDKQNLRQKLILLTACAAGNFPDLDLVLYGYLKSPLGYLLHHRGHSHTFLYEIPQAMFLALLISVLWPAARRLLKESSPARRGFFAALVSGFFLHIAMDFLNSYGVHPFHPLDSHWLYGDLVFIVEPIFWIAFGVPLAFLTKRVWLRYPVLLVVLGVPLFATFKGFVPWIAMLALTVMAAVMATMQSREPERGRRTLSLAFIIGLAFIFVQVATSQIARGLVRDSIVSNAPGTEFLDAAMTAMPANPFCWSYVSIEENKSADVYRLRSGILTIAPGVVAANACPRIFAGSDESKRVSANILEVGQAEGSLRTLKDVTEKNCHIQAWLRFARMPLVTETEASDFRFSRGLRGNFTSLKIPDFEHEPCSDKIPPWISPRADDLLKF